MKLTPIGKPQPTPCQITRLRLSPDGQTLAAAGFDGLIRRYTTSEAALSERAAPLKGHHGFVSALDYDSRGERLYSADTYGKLIAWNLPTGQPLWQRPAAHDGWLRALAISPQGKLLATCGRDQRIKLWSTEGELLHTITCEQEPFSLAFHPHQPTLWSGDLFGKVQEWSCDNAKPLRSVKLPDFYLLDRIQDVGGVRGLLFNPSGEQLITYGAQPKTGGFVQAFPLMDVLDTRSLKSVGRWKGSNDNEGFVHEALLLKDGTIAAVTSGQPGQGSVLLWKVGEAQPSFRGTLANAHSLALHPTEPKIVVAATNANSSGNGRVKGNNGDYPGNFSPLHWWTIS